MVFDWIKRAHELKKKGRPFAVATVINTVAPTSAKPMSKAIIHQNGDIEGFLNYHNSNKTNFENIFM